MYKRYFRKKDPECKPEEVEWIEMSGEEFYSYVTSPDGKSRHFIDMGDVVLEATEAQARKYREELNHSYYIRACSDGHSPLSLYSIKDQNGCCGEEVLIDESQDVEYQAIMRMDAQALYTALAQLDLLSCKLIFSLYLSKNRKTEQELAEEQGISQAAISKRKKKILKTLKILVIKIQKSQQ